MTNCFSANIYRTLGTNPVETLLTEEVSLYFDISGIILKSPRLTLRSAISNIKSAQFVVHMVQVSSQNSGQTLQNVADYNKGDFQNTT